jgi:hypothetical protein
MLAGAHKVDQATEYDRDILAAMSVLLNRDVRSAGHHVADNIPRIAEATVLVLQSEHTIQEYLENGWKP